MSKAEKMDEVRDTIVKKPLRQHWRVRKREQVGYSRYQIIELLYEANQPLTVYTIAFRIGKSYESIFRNVKILAENNVLCNKLDHMDGKTYFTICPVCPIKNNCNQKLEFWVKSGLLEPEKVPSEEFFETKGEKHGK